MNMKKTMAAIAAGAVAVSAMATTVSALQDATITYNLVDNYSAWDVWNAPTSTVEYTINCEAGVYPTTIQTYVASNSGKNLTMKVASNAAGEQNKFYTYSADKGALNYNPNYTGSTLTITNEFAGYTGALSITMTVSGDAWCDGSNKDERIASTNVKLAAVDLTTVADKGSVTPLVLKAFNDGKPEQTTARIPFKTDLTGNKDVINYLQTANVAGDFNTTKSYVNVKAVLNDAIENYDSVTFTFNTATENIGYVVNGNYKDIYTDNYWNGCNAKGDYLDAINAAGGDASKLTAVYTDKEGSTDKYKSFAQHLYTNNYAPEGTGYVGFDWAGLNLFQGALVVNESITMSLAETDYFDWAATSLSFDWDAIMDGAMTGNDYATWLHSMKLATSSTWYWDNLIVTLTAGAEEDGVDTEAGVVADDEELAEEEVEEEVTEEVEEEVEEPEVEVEVSNPTTGNASVALAVIPVALAAAAVVAKKRS